MASQLWFGTPLPQGAADALRASWEPDTQLRMRTAGTVQAGYVHIDRTGDFTDTFGPYHDVEAATHAMQWSVLIEGECQDDAPGDCWADTDPGDPAHRIVIDPFDPAHTGEGNPIELEEQQP